MAFWFLSPLNVFLTESQNRKAYFQVVAKMGFFNDVDSLNLEIHWSTGIEVVDVCDAANRQRRTVKTSY